MAGEGTLAIASSGAPGPGKSSSDRENDPSDPKVKKKGVLDPKYKIPSAHQRDKKTKKGC